MTEFQGITYIKLSKFANILGLTYRTILGYYHAGQIPGAIRLKTGTILVPKTAIREIGGKRIRERVETQERPELMELKKVAEDVLRKEKEVETVEEINRMDALERERAMEK